MLVYRIASTKCIRDLSGEGARRFGGRWNKKGISALYTSENLALAALEILANTPVFSMPDLLSAIILQIPETSITEIKSAGLPSDWKKYPVPDILKEMGSEWLLSGESLVLKVPSVIIDMEYNYILNSHHLLIEKVKIMNVIPFSFDGRLFKEEPANG